MGKITLFPQSIYKLNNCVISIYIIQEKPLFFAKKPIAVANRCKKRVSAFQLTWFKKLIKTISVKNKHHQRVEVRALQRELAWYAKNRSKFFPIKLCYFQKPTSFSIASSTLPDKTDAQGSNVEQRLILRKTNSFTFHFCFSFL